MLQQNNVSIMVVDPFNMTRSGASTGAASGFMNSPKYRLERMLRLALIEDDDDQAQAVVQLLGAHHMEVKHFAVGQAFLDAALQDSFDLVMMDWNLPDMSGYEVLRTMRAKLSIKTPVMMLTSRDAEYDIVQALNGGADDYMIKPWRPFELVARLQAMVRRFGSPEYQPNGQDGKSVRFTLDSTSLQITCQGQTARLTNKEYALAELLIRNLGSPVSREHISQTVWRGELPDSRTMDAHISRVRNKLRLTPDNGFSLNAIYGFGYRLEQQSNWTQERV